MQGLTGKAIIVTIALISAPFFLSLISDRSQQAAENETIQSDVSTPLLR